MGADDSPPDECRSDESERDCGDRDRLLEFCGLLWCPVGCRDGAGEEGGEDSADDGDIRRVFELWERGVVGLEDAEAEWETWLALA